MDRTRRASARLAISGPRFCFQFKRGYEYSADQRSNRIGIRVYPRNPLSKPSVSA
jgi:hypothetical protein